MTLIVRLLHKRALFLYKINNCADDSIHMPACVHMAWVIISWLKYKLELIPINWPTVHVLGSHSLSSLKSLFSVLLYTVPSSLQRTEHNASKFKWLYTYANRSIHCLDVYLCIACGQYPWRPKKDFRPLGNSYRWVWTTMWALGIKPGSSGRAAGVLNR